MIIALFRIVLYLPLFNLLTFFNWALPGHSAAVSIVVVTLLVRFILLIPSKRAAETQRKMNQLQPLLAELKKEYGDDKQGLATAQMELYKNNNINVLGSSCLPAIIQLVVLIIFYEAIRQGLSSDVTGVYPWMPHPSFVNTTFFGINMLQPDKFFIIPIVAAALQFILTRLITPPVQKNADGVVDPMMAAQRNMMYLLPATTLFAATRFPAGVALYWVVTTAFSIFQQRQVNAQKLAIVGVDAALKEVDVKHPEHKPRPKQVVAEIEEQTSTKKGVAITVRKKK